MNVKLYDMMFYGVKMVDSLLRENLSYVSQLWERCQKWSRVRAILRPHLPVTPRMMARIGGNSSEKEMFENCSNLPRLEVVDIFPCRGRNFWTWSPFFYEILWGSILFLSKSWHILCGWSKLMLMTFRRFLSFRRKTCCFGRESSEIKQFLFGPILIISHVPSCSIMFHPSRKSIPWVQSSKGPLLNPMGLEYVWNRPHESKGSFFANFKMLKMCGSSIATRWWILIKDLKTYSTFWWYCKTDIN